MRVLKVKVISLPYIFQVLYVLCFTRPRYQVSIYRTIGPLVLLSNKIFHHISSASMSARVFKFCIHDEDDQVYEQGWQNPGIYEYFPSRREIQGFPGNYLGNTLFPTLPLLQIHFPCLPKLCQGFYSFTLKYVENSCKNAVSQNKLSNTILFYEICSRNKKPHLISWPTKAQNIQNLENIW